MEYIMKTSVGWILYDKLLQKAIKTGKWPSNNRHNASSCGSKLYRSEKTALAAKAKSWASGMSHIITKEVFFDE
jgi:hypothetical protein